MKKTYINPTMDIVKIVSTGQLLAGSNFNKSGDDFGGGSGGTGDKGISSGDAREFDWDD